jgi:stage II sporulation protein P
MSERRKISDEHRPPRKEAGSAGSPGMVALALAACFFTVIYGVTTYAGALSSAAVFSAKLTVPTGGAQIATENLGVLGSLFASKNEDESESSASGVSSASSKSASSSASSAGSSPSGMKPVQTVLFGAKTGAKYENYENICVYNQTSSHKADIKNQLKIAPDFKIKTSEGPQVLIVHTHTTESFASADTGYYDPDYPTRNPDKSKSVVAVGNKIAQALEKNGIGVVHDTTYHDYPSYSNAYAKALASIQKDLKKYPSIKVILDIHRDAIQYSDGSRAKPTAVVDGKKAAQVMIISACNEPGSSLPVPDWQWNYRFALRIQQAMMNTYPTLARPLNLAPMRYNMHASHGALLIEFGTDVNTLEEVTYSGQLFGQVLSKVLLGLKG